MAVEYDHDVVKQFEDWYKSHSVSTRTGLIDRFELSKAGSSTIARYRDFKREQDARTHGFEDLELLVDAKVISEKDDLPNVSSGETAGLIRRMARNLVQNVPNLEVVSEHDEKSVQGILAKQILMSQIVGSDESSNRMQQKLFASAKAGLTIGFDCVAPVLLQRGSGEWVIDYDAIHYKNVFPEPGVRDVRDATEVFVRRYLTKGEVMGLIKGQVSGWNTVALKTMLETQPAAPPREVQTSQDRKRGVTASGYEIITWYSSSGAPFLTFCPNSQHLLRIEKNLHPAKQHPIFFLVLEADNNHPLGQSQVELILGRQEFQDLIHNGAMKMWYQNINPPIVGYGTVNALPNLSPGKFTQIANPNAKIETFEVNTQTLLQFNSIAQANQGAMINTVGSADQQMAVSAGHGFSATPQGVEAQQQMVDITTNNYQKAIEYFFSEYCSYALTIYFQELRATEKITPTAKNRLALINAGIQPEQFGEDGSLEISFEGKRMATQYWVRCVPGSLVELEDEKQLRILNQLFVPLSQAMPALAQMEDQSMLQNAAAALMFIVKKEIELSGSNRATELQTLMETGQTPEFNEFEARIMTSEETISGASDMIMKTQEATAQVLMRLQDQVGLLSQTQTAILRKLGVDTPDIAEDTTNEPPETLQLEENPI